MRIGEIAAKLYRVRREVEPDQEKIAQLLDQMTELRQLQEQITTSDADFVSAILAGKASAQSH
jgi:hypothetical protein